MKTYEQADATKKPPMEGSMWSRHRMIDLSTMVFLLRAFFQRECGAISLIGLTQPASTPASCSIIQSMMRFGSVILQMERRNRIRPSFGTINIIASLKLQGLISGRRKLAPYRSLDSRGRSKLLHGRRIVPSGRQVR